MIKTIKQPIWKTILGIVLVIILYFMGQIIPVVSFDITTTTGAILSLIMLTGVIIGMFLICKKFNLILGEKSSFKWWYLLLVIGCLGLNMVKNPLLILIFGGDGSTENGNILLDMTTTISPFFMFGMTALFAPIAEEIIFRGIGINVLFKKYPIIGLLVSSTLFSLMHVPTDLFSFTNYFTIGLMFGGVYLLTRHDLRWSIAAHLFNNTVLMIFLLLIG